MGTTFHSRHPVSSNARWVDDSFTPSTMGIFHNPASSSTPYKDDTPLPDSVPKVQELGVSSAPLKSAAFFIGAYCKEYNGVS